jgi:GT2 family glycosyltransferase
MPDDAPVTIVIATRDRRGVLHHTLQRLAALGDGTPVVVVDNGSRDGTPEAVRAAFPSVDVVPLDRDRGAAARNIGVERATTRHVAFLDDDSWWSPGALARAVDVLDAHPAVAVVAARVLVGDDERMDPTCAAMERSPLPDRSAAPGTPVLGFVACGAVVRREAFRAVGGFHERYGIGGEEALLAARLAAAGCELRYVPAVVAHHHPSTGADRSDRPARTLRNDLWTAWSTRRRTEALGVSWRLLRASGWRMSTLRGLAGALAGAGWVARHRRPVPQAVATQLRLLERQARPGPRGAPGEA